MSYLKEIVFTAVVCGIVSSLAAIGKNGSGKIVKFVCSLAFMCVLLSPLMGESDLSLALRDALDNIEITEYEIGNNNTGMEIVTEEICKAAARNAAEKFGVPAECFVIKLSLDVGNESPTINEATIYINGKAKELNQIILKEYFSKILNCSVEVKADEKNPVTA